MHLVVYRRFERLFHKYPSTGDEILEIAAATNIFETFLTLSKKVSETYHCVGININVKVNSTRQAAL